MFRYFLALLLLAPVAALAQGTSKPPVLARARIAPHTEVVEGYGRTAELARERALERAQERLRELMKDHLGYTGWEPSSELFEPTYLAQYNVLEWLGPAKVVPAIDQEPTFQARYQLTLTPEYLVQIRKELRLEQVAHRHQLLARILASLVAVFLVTAGYLRLEEMTRGFATGMLRLAAILLLGITAVILWLTW